MKTTSRHSDIYHEVCDYLKRCSLGFFILVEIGSLLSQSMLLVRLVLPFRLEHSRRVTDTESLKLRETWSEKLSGECKHVTEGMLLTQWLLVRM